MSYFPQSVMTLTPKEDSPVAGRAATMTSRRYNLHDEEIKSVEEFIGASDLFASQRGLSSGMLADVNSIIARLNALIDPSGGISVSSGMVRSGNRIIFPEPCMATFLSSPPSPSDASITVNSTAGFPPQGVISILNDMNESSSEVGFTNVEWIRYSSKTTSSFDGCERGYGGTFAGTHSSSATTGVTTEYNYKDYQGDADHDPVVHRSIGIAFADENESFTRHFPAWRRMAVYGIKILGLYGTLTDLTWKVARRAAIFQVYRNDADFSLFSNAAGGLGILRQRDDGTYYLESNDLAYALQGILTWNEANDFVNLTSLSEKGVSNQYWPPQSVPVFYGRMSLTLSIAATTRDQLYPMDGLRIRQDATGDLYAFNSSTYVPTYGMISYHAVLIGSQIDSPEMDLQPQDKGGSVPPIIIPGVPPTTDSGTSDVSGASGSSGAYDCEDSRFYARYHTYPWWTLYCAWKQWWDNLRRGGG